MSKNLVQLSEVLDGADHLRGVGVLVWRKTPCPKMNPSTDEKPFVPFLKAPSAFKWVLFEGCLPNSSQLRKQNHVIPGYPTYSVGYVDYKRRIAYQHDKSKEDEALCK